MTDTQRRDAQIAAELDGHTQLFGPHHDDPRRHSMHLFLSHLEADTLLTLQWMAADENCSVEGLAYRIWGDAIEAAMLRWRMEGRV